MIRIFNTYGLRMHPNDGRVVSNFNVQALKGEPITLYGTGSQSRSFCYVDDLVTGMIAMMDQDELVGPVNLGNSVEFTILELATMVKEFTRSKSEIVKIESGRAVAGDEFQCGAKQKTGAGLAEDFGAGIQLRQGALRQGDVDPLRPS